MEPPTEGPVHFEKCSLCKEENKEQIVKTVCRYLFSFGRNFDLKMEKKTAVIQNEKLLALLPTAHCFPRHAPICVSAELTALATT